MSAPTPPQPAGWGEPPELTPPAPSPELTEPAGALVETLAELAGPEALAVGYSHLGRPHWAMSWPAFRTYLRYCRAYSRAWAEHYGFRSFGMGLRLIWPATQVAAWGLLQVLLWVFDLEGRGDLRRERQAVDAGKSHPKTIKKAKRYRILSLIARLVLATLVALLIRRILWLPYATQPIYIKIPSGLVVAVLALVSFGLLGRYMFGGENLKPLNDGQAVTIAGPAPITPAEILGALESLGGQLAATIKALGPTAIRLVEPIVEDREHLGWSCRVALPRGIPASYVTRHREEFAAGLYERPVECVYVSAVTNQPATWLDIRVTKEPMSLQAPPKMTLADVERVNIFEPVPVGVDAHGEPVLMDFDEAAILIAAIRGWGKTTLALVLLCMLMKDPRTKLYLVDGKGGGEYKQFAKVAHVYLSAADFDKIGARVLAALQEILAEMQRRSEIFHDLGSAEMPHNRLTDALANRPDLGPIVLVLEECQAAFNSPTYGKEIQRLVLDLIQRGRSFGIWLILITQEPSKANIPPLIRNLCTRIFCGKVRTAQGRRATLGDRYRGPIDPLSFTMANQGTWVLDGAGPAPQLVRAPMLDATEVEQIVERGAASRAASDALTGMATGQQLTLTLDTSPTVEFVAHLSAVWPRPAPIVTRAHLTRLLAAHDPARYGRWRAGDLTKAAKAAGIRIPDPHHFADPDSGTTQTHRCLHLVDVETVMFDQLAAAADDVASTDDEAAGD